MNREFLNIFNILSRILKSNTKKNKYKITLNDYISIQKTYPGRKYKDENGEKCSRNNWYNYVVYNSINTTKTINESIIYSLEKLKEYNG